MLNYEHLPDITNWIDLLLNRRGSLRTITTGAGKDLGVRFFTISFCAYRNLKQQKEAVICQ